MKGSEDGNGYSKRGEVGRLIALATVVWTLYCLRPPALYLPTV